MISKLMKTSALALATSLTALSAAAQDGDARRVAFLASSSQNGYNQAIYAGVERAAKALGNVTVEIFDGEFSATTQFAQVEDLVAGGRFDALIVTPNDTVGIATALEGATDAGLVVAATLFPIGPDLKSMDPQVPGLTTTVAADPSISAAAAAEAVVRFCADKNPCNVAIIIGQLIYPFDNLRHETYLKVLGEHENIKIVATGEGNYSPDVALKSMQDILQANPGIHAVLSNADQHLIGIEIALTDAGIKAEDIYLIGCGLNQITVDAIRSGKIDATLAEVPASMGEAALNAVAAKLDGKDVERWIDPQKLRDIPLVVDKAWLDANPDFAAEWPG